jgi:hypothetical protein
MPKSLWSLDAGRCLGRLCLFAPLAATVLLTARGEAADQQTKKNPTLEEALLENAPKIRDFLWEHMKHPDKSLHIGVLKFLVQTGDRPPSDNAGPLNLHIARRLEAALILTLRETDADKVRILHNPSAVLMRNANHLCKDGRKAFFQRNYPPAWGDPRDMISADVFVTGLVKISGGSRILDVTVKAFDETDKKLVRVCNFQAAADPRLLTEAGVSFALSRGSNAVDMVNLVVASNGRESPAEVSTRIPSDKKKKAPTVRELLQEAPIDFQVLYNGERQKVGENGAVCEPAEETKVTFRLKHKNRDDCTYGVVLKINGENSIYPKELQLDDFRGHKWVLSPKDNFLIKGYLKEDIKDEAAKFTVLPGSESRVEEVNYGAHAGTFTIIIYRGRPDGQKQPDSKDRPDDQELEVVNAIIRGVPDQLVKTENTLKALKGDLLRQRADARKNGVPKGLIVAGEPTKQKVEPVQFHGYSLPVSVIHLRYYKPRSE